MQYALLIYSDEATNPKPGTSEGDQLVADYYAYTTDIQAQGIMQGGNALVGTEAATTVRVRDGDTLTTDGPFAETKEVLGGFFIIDCESQEEAIEWAKQGEALGAGEIVVKSIDADGTRAGYELNLTRRIVDAVQIPVIASGGVGTLDHLVEGVRDGHAAAVLAASIFHFGTYSLGAAKAHMAAAGIPMRPSPRQGTETG